jgi:hypothetical protein
MKFRFRLWHVGLLAALALFLPAGLMVAFWPSPTSDLLTEENYERCSRFANEAEFEQLFGPPWLHYVKRQGIPSYGYR